MVYYLGVKQPVYAMGQRNTIAHWAHLQRKATHKLGFAKEPNLWPNENSNICQYSDLLAFF
ncbi:hypothetical protein CLV98_104165 [Dyadobacter jejuensis]|uniref:Uncharacterized protein n=1 Tax=Dyadobacter jejuensis TaxID=1082580 RepID=A0A316AKZ6_9BACT|nr:hypothetical protein CLV98_104165 [Dyadobacter jejuensis]